MSNHPKCDRHGPLRGQPGYEDFPNCHACNPEGNHQVAVGWWWIAKGATLLGVVKVFRLSAGLPMTEENSELWMEAPKGSSVHFVQDFVGRFVAQVEVPEEFGDQGPASASSP